MRVAIIQSGYIPWRGYFDIIHDVDVFIFLDHVQFTKRDWRSRNKIKFSNGKAQWLTIPIGKVKTHPYPNINEVALPKNNLWMDKHWKLIEANYKKAPFFKECSPAIRSCYDKNFRLLSDFNQNFIITVSRLLGIKTLFFNSVFIKTEGKKTDLLMDLLLKLGANTYITGEKAKSYLEEEKFEQNDIRLIYKNYEGYPEYPQRHGKFSSHVSILDLLFNAGMKNAPRYIWGWKEN